jgi:ribonuclease D
MMDALSSARELAFDIESNGFHHFRERTCILTLSADGRHFVLDTLALWDQTAHLGKLFADPAVTLRVHGGSYDVASMKRDWGFSFTSLTDTYLAAQLLGHEATGLAGLMKAHFDVDLPKELQRYDWTQRPLASAHLAYLINDTAHLAGLAHILDNAIAARDLAEEYRIECESLAAMPASIVPAPDPEGFRRIKASPDLSDRGRGALKHLCLLRDQIALAEDLAAFRVASPEGLFRIAVAAERGQPWPGDLSGFNRNLKEAFASRMDATIAAGLADPQPRNPPRKTQRTGPIPTRAEMDAIRERERRLKQWRNKEAEARGIGIQAVLPTPVLEEISRDKVWTRDRLSAIRRLGTRRLERYADTIADLTAK